MNQVKQQLTFFTDKALSELLRLISTSPRQGVTKMGLAGRGRTSGPSDHDVGNRGTTRTFSIAGENMDLFGHDVGI